MKIVKTKFASLIVLALIVSVTAVTAVASACDDKEANQKANFEARYEQAQTAIANGDYDAWASTVAEGKGEHAGPMREVLNADNFYLLGELAEARANYDRDAAAAILGELGLEFPGPRGSQEGKGGHQYGRQ